MLVQFGNNWIQKIPLTAKLDSAYGLVQFWLSSEFFSSNYFQIGQHVVLLHIQITLDVQPIQLYGQGTSVSGHVFLTWSETFQENRQDNLVINKV